MNNWELQFLISRKGPITRSSRSAFFSWQKLLSSTMKNQTSQIRQVHACHWQYARNACVYLYLRWAQRNLVFRISMHRGRYSHRRLDAGGQDLSCVAPLASDVTTSSQVSHICRICCVVAFFVFVVLGLCLFCCSIILPMLLRFQASSYLMAV